MRMLPPLAAIRERIGSPKVARILIRGAMLALLIHIAGNGIGYIVQIILARWLGVKYYGVFTYFAAWAQVFTIIAALGLDLGMVRFIPEYLVRQDGSRLRGLIRWSRSLVLGAGLVIAGISIVALLIIRPIQSSTAAVVLGSLLIPLLALLEIQTQMIRSASRIVLAYAPTVLMQPVLLLCLTFGILKLSDGIADYSAVAALLVAMAILLAIQAGIVEAVYSRMTKHVRPIFESRAWGRVSLPLLAYSILVAIMFRVDTLMVGFFLGSEEVGIYGAAVKTATIVSFTLLATNTIVGPIITTYHARRDMAALQKVISMATLGSFGLSLLIAGGIFLFHTPLLLAFGGEFIRARLPLFILMIGQLVNVGSGSAGLLMVLTGHERQSVLVVACCALAVSVSCILVIPVFGIGGAAAVSMAGICVCNFWVYRLTVRYLGIHSSVFFAAGKLLFNREA